MGGLLPAGDEGSREEEGEGEEGRDRRVDAEDALRGRVLEPLGGGGDRAGGALDGGPDDDVVGDVGDGLDAGEGAIAGEADDVGEEGLVDEAEDDEPGLGERDGEAPAAGTAGEIGVSWLDGARGGAKLRGYLRVASKRGGGGHGGLFASCPAGDNSPAFTILLDACPSYRGGLTAWFQSCNREVSLTRDN